MERSQFHSARIAPASEPLDGDIQKAIDRVMRGLPPLTLFTTLARDRRLFFKYFGGGLLDRGNLTMRQREIVIDRTTARCGAEYEWGVHITGFAAVAELSTDQVASLAHGNSSDDCWDERDRVLIDLCDALHDTATVNDELWKRLASIFSENAILELLLLAGFYHTTAFVVNALALAPEQGMARFRDFPHAPSTNA